MKQMNRIGTIVCRTLMTVGLASAAVTLLTPICARGPTAHAAESAAFIVMTIVSLPLSFLVCALPIDNPEFIFLAFPLSVIGNAFLWKAVVDWCDKWIRAKAEGIGTR